MDRRTMVLLAAEAGAWWVVLWGVWVLTLSAFSLAETVTAAVATAPAAAAAVASRRVEGVAWRPASWVARCAIVWPATVVCDTARVLAAIVTRRTGGLTEVRLPAGQAADDAPAREAFAMLLIGSTPSSVIVDVPRGGRQRVHGLGSGPPRIDRWRNR